MKQAAKKSHALLPRSTGGRFISLVSAELFSRLDNSKDSMAEGARIEVSLMMDSDDMTKKGNYPPEKETIRSTSKMIKEIPFVSNTSSYESDETNPRESEVPKKKEKKNQLSNMHSRCRAATPFT